MRVALIGGGVIGGGWVARFALNGHRVRVFDPDPEAARKIEAVATRARRALPMLYDRALPEEGAITQHATIAEACEGAGWIVEAVPERLDFKRRIIAEVQAASDAPLASSTSGFTPSQLSEGAPDPSRVIVCHPFNPVYLLPLVEVVGAPHTAATILDGADRLLTSLGMAPLRIQREIDAHVADRLLEAVWREALWLVRDGIATTGEIDEAIRLGFGLRWAQMGLFETYRIAGGEGGMAQFLAQFGPALKWPWTKLMDVPELDDALVARIAAQSDAQAAGQSIADLERERDDNLVAILRSLKTRGTAAGRVVAAHESTLPVPGGLRTQDRTVPVDWTDYNGHMNESRYGQVFSDAADALLDAAGARPATADKMGMSWFTVSSRTDFRAETIAGERIVCDTRVKGMEGRKLTLAHVMARPDGTPIAQSEQLLLHVDLATRRACDPPEAVAAALSRLMERS